MKPTDLPRELIYPFTEVPVLLAMIGFWLLGTLATAAGMFGIWLSLILLPAFFRYGLYLLEARARGRTPPAAGIELFNWLENFWSLFPLVLVGVFVWGTYYLANNVSTPAAWSLGIFIILVFPASLGVLAVTRSALPSLNPVVLLDMIRSSGWNYAFVPAGLIIVGLAIKLVLQHLLPGFLLGLLEVYVFFLLFSLTGAIMPLDSVAMNMQIPDAIEPGADVEKQKLATNRRTVASHAYGFISRGNRAGGLAHIQSQLDNEADQDEAFNWFFDEMLQWENTDAALFLAQTYLHSLLLQQRDPQVLKLLSQCFYANTDFRPAEDDRDAALQLVRRYGRNDLLEFMR